MTKRLDGWVEQTSRWTAARLTRRSLFARAGRAAVMIAGGAAGATVLTADPAGARVCGQSGYSEKCLTFDCPDGVWGWCWYAVGCCADGALKKICDCCVANYPNVHGYCPSGTNVKCLVESCGRDPRVQRVAISTMESDDPFWVAAAVRAIRFPHGSPHAVLADAATDLGGAIAMPVGSAVDGPVYRVPRRDLDSAVLDLLRNGGAQSVKIVDPWLPPTVDEALLAAGFAVERVGVSTDVGLFSVEVAAWLRRSIGATRAAVIEPAGLSAESFQVAAAMIAAPGQPLLIGAAAAVEAERQAAAEGLAPTTWFIGPEAAAGASQVAGAKVLAASDLLGQAAACADAAVSSFAVPTATVALVPHHHPAGLALAELRMPVLFHEPGVLWGAADWLYRRRDTIGRVLLFGAGGKLSTGAYYELQSVLNGYENHKLIGVAGQGLPAISQPPAERPVGAARV